MQLRVRDIGKLQKYHQSRGLLGQRQLRNETKCTRSYECSTPGCSERKSKPQGRNTDTYVKAASRIRIRVRKLSTILGYKMNYLGRTTRQMIQLKIIQKRKLGFERRIVCRCQTDVSTKKETQTNCHNLQSEDLGTYLHGIPIIRQPMISDT